MHVVDGLESIEVNEQHGHLAVGALAHLQLVFNDDIEACSVGETGQRVVMGFIPRFFQHDTGVDERIRQLDRFLKVEGRNCNRKARAELPRGLRKRRDRAGDTSSDDPRQRQSGGQRQHHGKNQPTQRLVQSERQLGQRHSQRHGPPITRGAAECGHDRNAVERS